MVQASVLDTTTITTSSTAFSETVYMEATKNNSNNNNNNKHENNTCTSSIHVLHNVAAMPQYAQHSLEELRWQDYCHNQQQHHDHNRSRDGGGILLPTGQPHRRGGTVLEYVAPETLPSDMVLIGRGVSNKSTATSINGTGTAAAAASNEDEEEDCPICLERLRPILPITRVVRNEPQQQLTVRLEGCGHLFHAACLNAAVVQSKPACPNCRHELGRASTGKMPSGTMTIVPVATGDCSLLLSVNNNNHHHHHHHHHGNNNNNCCIAIYYDFPAGYQKAFHPAPGMLHQAANFTAYLPDHAQGRALLERLKQAFAGGLTFLVGSSFGSNNTLPNPICEWIPHKPSLEALLADDPGFWHNCHKQLDLVGVPNAASYPS